MAVDLLPGSGGHWQDSLSHGYNAKGSSFVLVIGWRPFSALCHADLLTQPLTSSKTKRESL